MAVRLRTIFFVGILVLFLYAFSTSYLFSRTTKKPLYYSRDPNRNIPTVTKNYFNRRAVVTLSGEYMGSFDDFWDFLPSWKPHLLDAIDRYVDSNTVFVDGGAWEGPALFYAAQTAKLSLAYEPDPRAFEALKNHREVSPHKNTIVLTKECISDRQQTLQLVGNGEKTSVVERVPYKFLDENIRVGDHRVTKVACDSLPNQLKAKGVKGNAKVFIKLDLEGSEAFVLPSLVDWVKQREVKPVFFVGIHDTLEGSDAATSDKIFTFIRLFKYCGRDIASLKDCSTITLEDLEHAQDLLLTDYK